MANRRRLTDKSETGVLAAYRGGISRASLARKYKCSFGAIDNLLRRNGVRGRLRRTSPPGRTPSFSRQDQKKIVARYKLGETVDELAVAFRVSKKAISNAIRRRGATLRPRGVPRKEPLRQQAGAPARKGPPLKLSPEQQAEALTRYRLGEAAHEIAATFGVHRKTVANAIRRGNIALRRSGPRPIEFSAKLKDKVTELWRDGQSHEQMAATLKIPFGRVRKIVGDLGLPKRPRRFIPKRWVKPDGYVYINLAKDDPMRAMCQNANGNNQRGYVLEHRVVMAGHLGRPLLAAERVHHRNGKRGDNRIENLELWTLGHKDPSGVRVADCIVDRFAHQPEIARLKPNIRRRVMAALRLVASA